MKIEKICCAGFGGQGTLSMGKILAYAGMLEGKEVTWSPSYGPEMRGGTANCHVVLSDEPVGSPVVTENASCVIAMNQPSLDKFAEVLADDGALVVNADLATYKGEKEVRLLSVPANSMAVKEFGNTRLANIVLLGAVVYATNCVEVDYVDSAFEHVFSGPKAKFVPDNKKAFALGYEFAKSL